MGSSLFGCLFFTLTLVSNGLFLAISVLLWGLTNSESYLVAASLGIWSVLLAIIAVECAQAPPDTKRRLFFLTVSAIYYPLVLLALFSMFAGVKLAYVLGVAVGYVEIRGNENVTFVCCHRSLINFAKNPSSGMRMAMES